MKNQVAMEFVSELAFPVTEFEARLAALNEKISASRFDALVIHIPENVNYISAWHTPGYYYPQFVVVKPGSKPIIILRALEALGLPVRSWFSDDQLITFTDTENPIDKLVEAIEGWGLHNQE